MINWEGRKMCQYRSVLRHTKFSVQRQVTWSRVLLFWPNRRSQKFSSVLKGGCVSGLRETAHRRQSASGTSWIRL